MVRPICIDPGHGGNDPGAVGPTGLRESDVVLDIALRVVQLLDDRGRAVLMTRDSDTAISLQQRTRIANNASSRLFVSLHCNAFTSPDANGVETWFWDGSVIGEKLANHIQRHIVATTGWRDRGVKATRSFYVLNRTTMPAVLVELGFISNPEEEAALRLDDMRQKIAEAIVLGIEDYIEEVERK